MKRDRVDEGVEGLHGGKRAGLQLAVETELKQTHVAIVIGPVGNKEQRVHQIAERVRCVRLEGERLAEVHDSLFDAASVLVSGRELREGIAKSSLDSSLDFRLESELAVEPGLVDRHRRQIHSDRVVEESSLTVSRAQVRIRDRIVRIETNSLNVMSDRAARRRAWRRARP